MRIVQQQLEYDIAVFFAFLSLNFPPIKYRLPIQGSRYDICSVLVALHLIDTGAGVVYSMSTQVTNMDVPYVWVHAMFCVLLATVVALLVWIGGDRHERAAKLHRDRRTSSARLLYNVGTRRVQGTVS